MKFRNEKTICPKCHEEHDAFVANCPNCNRKNPLAISAPASKNLFWMSANRQIIVFLIGFLGFQLISGILSLVFTLIISQIAETPEIAKAMLGSEEILMSLNILSYLFALVGIFICIYPYASNLFKTFLKGRKLLIGLGFGVLLIVSSILYGLLINSIPGLQDLPSNENQQTITKIVASYPFASILLFGIVGPLVEECTYRLGLFTILNRKSRLLSYIISICVFALIHFNFAIGSKEELMVELINIPSYFIGGLLLALCYDVAGFSASSVAHVTNNMYSIVMMLISLALQGSQI